MIISAFGSSKIAFSLSIDSLLSTEASGTRSPLPLPRFIPFAVFEGVTVPGTALSPLAGDPLNLPVAVSLKLPPCFSSSLGSFSFVLSPSLL